MTVRILEEGRDGVVLARVETSVGTLDVLTEVTLVERKLVLSGLHVYGVNVDPNALGLVRVRHLVQEIMEDLDVDEITIEGAVRVTGAGPGRTPRRVRFTRKVSPDEQAESD
jgi:hypothetical protein